MTELIARELREVLTMFLCGATVMMLFGVRDNIIKRLNIRRAAEVFAHFLSWICAAFLFSEFLYKASYGILRWYEVAAFVTGMLLWKSMICDKIILSIGMRKWDNTEDKEKREYEQKKKKKNKSS